MSLLISPKGHYTDIGVDDRRILQALVPQQLERQIVRGMIVGIVGFIGTAASLVFMLFGPELNANAAIATVTIVIGCVLLVLIALISTCGPVVTYLVAERLRNVRSELDAMEAQQEAVSLEQELATVVRALDDLAKSEQVSNAKIEALVRKYQRALRESEEQVQQHVYVAR